MPDSVKHNSNAPRTEKVRGGLCVRSIIAFVKKEVVLSIAALAALITAFFVPPDAEWLGYIDFRVIGLLFCLMAVVAGLVKTGLFDVLSSRLCARTGTVRALSLVLINLAFFISMLVTNDVALIMLVPLTLGLLRGEKQRAVITAVVLETMAANLGSMATPVGNPQNIYLFSCYAMTAAEFFGTVLPIAALSLVLLNAAGFLLLPKEPTKPVPAREGSIGPKRLVGVSAILFIGAILAVLRIFDWRECLVITAVLYLIIDRSIFREVDWFLLATFVMFFIFSGNLGRIEPVRNILAAALGGREMLVSAAVSQVISNVPAAVMLSGFTDNARGLLAGTNIGGLGTPVASLASLISLRFYFREENAARGRFFLVFLALNFAFAAALAVFAIIIEF